MRKHQLENTMALPIIIAIERGKDFWAMDLPPAHSSESWKSRIVAFCQGITVSYIYSYYSF